MTNEHSDQPAGQPKLSAKQRLFVEQYTIDHNASQAAIRAGYTGSARQTGYRLLHTPVIAAAISEREANLADEIGITKQWILTTQMQVVQRAMTGQPKVGPTGEVVTVTHHGQHDDQDLCTDQCVESIVHEWYPTAANQGLLNLMKHRGMLAVERHQVEVSGHVNYSIQGVDMGQL